MWHTLSTVDSRGTRLKLQFFAGKKPLQYIDYIELCCINVEFAQWFSEQLSSVGFQAFRWETPACSLANLHSPFECVLIDSPDLLRPADGAAFLKYFQSAGQETVIQFRNLSGDALLIVPTPTTQKPDFEHLAAFLRNATADQKEKLWQVVGEALKSRISNRPLWLNTSGAAVAWLHVRLDSSPKYYRHREYAMPSPS